MYKLVYPSFISCAGGTLNCFNRCLYVHERCTKGKMFTPIRISGAVILSALIAFAVTAAPAANRQEHLPASAGQAVPAALTGGDCSQHAWPNYESGCQFDVKRDRTAGRIVRVIALR